jgi:hypothetical protein
MVNCQFKTNRTIGADAYSDAGCRNEVSGGAYGGAVCELGGVVTNINGSFVGNQALASLIYYRLTTGNPGQGGACFNSGGSLVVSGASFISNAVAGGHGGTSPPSAPGQGGAVFSAGSLWMSNCNFGFNQAVGGDWGWPNGSDGSGGAIFCAGPSSINQSWFFGNVVRGGGSPSAYGIENGTGRGGAIYNSNTVSIIGCTFSTNEAFGTASGMPAKPTSGYGGAIYNVGSCQFTNNTLVGNLAVGGNGRYGYGGAYAYGGAIYNASNTVISVNNTFASNAAVGGTGSPNGTGCGGAICNSNGTVNLYNTIVANSTSGSNCWGTMSDLGHNLSSDNSAGFSAAGSLNNTDPKVGPLNDYGGPTPTVPLLTGSPAIDGGSTATAPATDQRGRSRPYGAAADIGAFESSAPFIVEGKISGSTGVVIFSAGTTNLAVTNAGTYWFRTLPAGGCVITPSNASYVFVPNTRLFTLGPDQLNADFKAFHWNTINIDGTTNSTLHLIYAGTNGQTYRVLTASNLTGPWLPVATNTLLASNYFDVFLPMPGGPLHLYRAVNP